MRCNATSLQGHISQGNALLAPYLPQQGVTGSPYAQGGALFALGLINANHGGDVVQQLRTALSSAQSEIVQHGAALGLGVAAMALDDTGMCLSVAFARDARSSSSS